LFYKLKNGESTGSKIIDKSEYLNIIGKLNLGNLTYEYQVKEFLENKQKMMKEFKEM